MANCALNAIPKWEKKIKLYISKSKNILNEEEYSLLIENQKAYEKYKETKIKLICKTYSKNKPELSFIEKENISKERADFLRRFYNSMVDIKEEERFRNSLY